MHEFMKTIISAIKSWVSGEIKDASKASVADWNQNDVNADNYIKNRTHWEEGNITILVDQLTSEKYQSGNHPRCNFIPGNAYDVIWNDVLYKGLICHLHGDYNVIGNPKNLPFNIDDDGGNGLYVESADGSDFTVSILGKETIIHKLDLKYLPDDIGVQSDWTETDENSKGFILNKPDFNELIVQPDWNETDETSKSFILNKPNIDTKINEVVNVKMDKENPNGTGSFSMNRKADSSIGSHSTAIGFDTIAQGAYSTAEGHNTIALESGSHTEGRYNIAFNYTLNGVTLYSQNTSSVFLFRKSSNFYLSTKYEVNSNGEFILKDPILINSDDLYEQWLNYNGYYAIFQPNFNTVGTRYHHLSENTITGIYLCKLPDDDDDVVYSHNNYYYGFYAYPAVWSAQITPLPYAHIVGNGNSDNERSNAHTLDWEGNAWFAGDVYVGSTSGINKDEGSKKLATISDIDEKIMNYIPESIVLHDVINGYDYVIEMRNGNLVSHCKCDNIKVTTPPLKTNYINGERFDSTGMVVTMTACDGSTHVINDISYDTLVNTSNVNNFVISYVDAGIVYTDSITLYIEDTNASLDDFEYQIEDNGIYTLTAWKGTYNGEPSSKIVIPNSELIKVN